MDQIDVQAAFDAGQYSATAVDLTCPSPVAAKTLWEIDSCCDSALAAYTVLDSIVDLAELAESHGH